MNYKKIDRAILANMFRAHRQQTDLFKDLLSYELNLPIKNLDAKIRKLASGEVKEINKDALVDLLNDVDRLRTLSSEFALMSGSGLKLESSWINLRDLVSRCLDLFEAWSVREAISVSNEVDKSLFIYSDPKYIQPIISIFVNNAIEALLKVKRERAKTLFLYAKESHNQLGLHTVDNGCGISGEDQSKVFLVPFTTKNLEGSGFGLPMAQFVADEAGLKVDFISSQDQGSSFSLWFPQGNFATKN